MREGYFKIHRQLLDRDAWKNPKRTLAWIDLISMADHKTGIVACSYGYLAVRWGVSKGTTFTWIQQWVTERSLERLPERDAERDAERWFVVNYAKYQDTPERSTERGTKRKAERRAEQIEEIQQVLIHKNETLPLPSASPSVEAVVTISRTTPPPAHPSDRKPRPLEKKLIPMAMFAILRQIKFPTGVEVTGYIRRNKRISEAMHELPLETLASVMVMAEDHWDKKQDYKLGLETADKQTDAFLSDGLPDPLVKRRDALLAAFSKYKDTVLTPSPVIAHV